jgi:hypothetical protein
MSSDPTGVGVHETILRAQVALYIGSGHSYVIELAMLAATDICASFVCLYGS